MRKCANSTIIVAVAICATATAIALKEPAMPEIPESSPIDEAVAEAQPAPPNEISWYYGLPMSDEIQSELWQMCRARGVPIALMLALIETESGFRTNAISPTGDYGLCQINGGNISWLQEELGITDILSPAGNINAGTYILGELLKKYPEEKALVCYNMGENGARGIESTKYSRQVLERRKKYEN